MTGSAAGAWLEAESVSGAQKIGRSHRTVLGDEGRHAQRRGRQIHELLTSTMPSAPDLPDTHLHDSLHLASMLPSRSAKREEGVRDIYDRGEREEGIHLWERGVGGAGGASAILGDCGAVRALRLYEPLSSTTRPRGVSKRREEDGCWGREGESEWSEGEKRERMEKGGVRR